MLGNNVIALAQHYWLIACTLVFILYLAFDFYKRFYSESIILGEELQVSISALREIGLRNGNSLIELDEVGAKAMQSRALSHLWTEYGKTLHPQRHEDEGGQVRIVRWRSTALAETFFTEQAIVDSRLKTEYFKHLPGVLTGLGIIGTFGGLIFGLMNFNVDVDPTKAQEQLQGLINSVGHAFIVSAVAIILAMGITWREKSSITALYRQVEELREIIDSLFTSGAGEEYLERVAVAAETSSTQAVQLKEILVAELKGNYPRPCQIGPPVIHPDHESRGTRRAYKA